MPGPPPKNADERVRRNAVVPMTVLPPVTLREPPAWPLAAPHVDVDEGQDATALLAAIVERELEIWSDLWRLPQATVWWRQHAHRLVARYARLLVDAEGGHAKSAAECRLLEDRLLLNPLAMSRAHYTVADDELAGRREADLAAVEQSAAPPAVGARPARKTATRKRLAVDKSGAAATA